MDRYIVQFCEKGCFSTDRTFRDGLLDMAKDYVCLVVDGLVSVTEGVIFDTATNGVAYRYTESDGLINAVFGEPEEYEDPNGSAGIDDDEFVKYEGPDDPEIRYR